MPLASAVRLIAHNAALAVRGISKWPCEPSSKHGLRVYHHEWGPIIQNRFGLSGRNEALIEDCRSLYGIRMRSHFSEFELAHLSQVRSLMPRNSAFVVILESLWRRLHQIEDAKRGLKRDRG